MEIKYLIEHKDSRLYVKTIEKNGGMLTTDVYNCLHFISEEIAKKDLAKMIDKDEFEIVEHGFG